MAVQTETEGRRAAQPAKCRRCNAALVSPIVCGACNALFAVSDSDYFDLLGLPRRHALDEKHIRDAFRAIARNVHPDRFADQPAEVRALATRLSAEVNQAVHVLGDPVRRAGYLLELSGGPSAAESREVPQNVLSDVMMIREEIEQARAASDPAAVARHREAIAERKGQMLRKIAESADGIATSSDEAKNELRRLLNSMKYYDNLLAELAEDPLARQDLTA